MRNDLSLSQLSWLAVTTAKSAKISRSIRLLERSDKLAGSSADISRDQLSESVETERSEICTVVLSQSVNNSKIRYFHNFLGFSKIKLFFAASFMTLIYVY